ncbi:hypothetical protein M9Y10_028110 [Tritrichomonas musculus]|uniref:ATPase AAA-type core domain-containing protein n=1 Tax=Tritrichomonas musculus TaxID=1915356 RepID=A0ABR2KIE8_9EUKA
MPPKGEPKGGAHNKQAAKIKKPSIQSPSNSKGKGNARGGIKGNNRNLNRWNRSVTEENDSSSDLNNSLDLTINSVQEEDSWLNHLPPVVKTDEDLHIKLLKERKERDKKKHFDFCHSELKAILNIALTEVDLPSNDRDNFLQKTRIDFFNGLYHDPISNTPRSPKANKSNSTPLPTISNENGVDVNRLNSDFAQLKKSIHQLLDSDTMTNEEASKPFSIQSSNSSLEFDVNLEMNKIFSRINQEMQPYINQDEPTELLNFPFLICIVGPPCSGKSTICQFIAAHFDVHIICVKNPDSLVSNKTNLNAPLASANISSNIASNNNSKTDPKVNSSVNSNNVSFADEEENIITPTNSLNTPFVICSSDDKVIINTIITEISDLPEKKGVIITNYPDTKNQLTQLEKSLQAAMKKKGDGIFRSINGIIRASMTAEEAARQVQKRLIDRSTGLVFHPIFNPPDVSPNSKFNTEPYPYQITSNLNSTRNLPSSAKSASNKNTKNNAANINNNEQIVNNVTNPLMGVYADLIGIYSKVNPQLSTFDNIMKKIGPLASIGFCSSIGQQNLLVESFLKAVYKSKNIEPPFTSFVVFETQDQFYYSKLCYNVFQIWDKECVPQFRKQINSLCEKLKYLKSKIDYLLDISMQMFSLIISKQDNRKIKTIEFIKSQDEIRNKIRQLQLIKAEKEAKKGSRQSSQLSNETKTSVLLRPRANTCINSRAKTALYKSKTIESPIKKTKEQAIMTIRTRNLYLRNVFPNFNIDDLCNNRNIALKAPESLNFKQKIGKTIKNTNTRPYTAISDIHKNLNLNSFYNSDINKIDTDKEIKKEEKNLTELQIDFYHSIWQQTIELRNRNTRIVDRFVRRSPMKALKSIMEENVKIIFDGVLKRYFLVVWFLNNLYPLLEKKETEKSNQTLNTSTNNIIKNIQKPNYRQGSKLNLLAENIFLENDNYSNITSQYNITDFPHPTLPNYDLTNLRDLCSLMHIEYKELDEDKSDINFDQFRSTKSSEVIAPNFKNISLTVEIPDGSNKNSSEDESLSSDSCSFAYLMTPTNRLNNMSKTPTTANNVWFPDVASTTVISSCRNNENPLNQIIVDKEKKKLYFPPIISFDHSSSSYMGSSSVSGVLSSRTAISTHSIRTSSEALETIDDESEANYYSDSGYSYKNGEEEEVHESVNKKINQPYFPFHFPEWRKCNRLSSQKLNNEDLSSSSSLNIQIESKPKKSKIKAKINQNEINDQKETEKVDDVNQTESSTSQQQNASHTCSTRHHRHHITKEESIRNFLTYLQIETNDPTIKIEAGVMLDFFVHFLDEKSLIDVKIDNEIKKLREDLKKMIQKKCAKEMEIFSQRFRSYKDQVDEQILQSHKQFSTFDSDFDSNNNEELKPPDFKKESNAISEQGKVQLNNENTSIKFDFDIDNLKSDDLFPFDTSFMTERCIEILNALDCNFMPATFIDYEDANNESNGNVGIGKLKKLYSYYFNKCSSDMKSSQQPSEIHNNNDSSKFNSKIMENNDKTHEQDKNNDKETIIDDDNDETNDDPDYFVSLDDLNAAMDLFEFTEKEKMFIEANVRIKTIPKFINILYFIRSFLPKDVALCSDTRPSTNGQNSMINTAKNSNSALPDHIKVDDNEYRSLIQPSVIIEEEGNEKKI